MARVWITDGSLPVFSDTERLSASHRGFLGLPVRYEGFVDPEVAVGSAEVAGERPDDLLFAEAEWCVLLEDPLTEPDDATPVVLQGLIEGKWMNRLLGTKAWRPASIANNVLASGPGISTSLGALASGAGETRLSYHLPDGRTQEHVTTLGDLEGENVPELVREVVRLHAEQGERLDAINLGANGERAAVVNEKARLKAAVRSPNPLNLLPHRAKERLVKRAIADGISVPPGTAVTLTTTDGAGQVVGDASLVWRQG
ncbi:MAG TPA: hypothetical protein VH420_06235 [Gaiellaceae bacterium]|jgi:hypothetical protein